MARYLIYNFSGEIDDLSHLFPNERLAQLAAVIRAEGGDVEVWDRGNIGTLSELAPRRWKRRLAAGCGERIFRKLARGRLPSAFDKLLYGLPLRWTSASMLSEIEANYARFVEQEAARIADGGFDAVFLNLWQGGFAESMRLAELVKRAASLPVYGIGQRVDWFGEHVLRLFGQLDGIILGLGYEAVRRLLGGAPFASLPDVAYRDDSGELVCNERSVTEVVDLPHPLYDAAVYKGIEHLIPLYHVSLSNQACPNRCAFCPRPANYGHVVRTRPLDLVVDHVEELRRRGVRHFRIADSTPPPRLLTDFARAIVERRLHEQDCHFTAFSRIDQNRQEDFSLIRRANFEALFFGLETLDDEGLKRIHKGITYAQMHDTLQTAHDAGLFVVGSVIFPMPGETEQSRRTTLERLRALADVLDSVLIQPAGVYPRSDWGTKPDEFGIRLAPDYIEAAINYPVKYIIPMRFWPPFPFSYELMGRRAEQVTFDDIRELFESFSREVWQELGICNVQDYTLLVAKMLGEDPYAFTDYVKCVLVTRDYDAISRIVSRSRQGLA